MEAELLEKVKSTKCAKVTFDLKHVDYVASAFIRICLATAERVKHENFSIINTTPFIKKVFKVAGIDETLNVT
jgi:anti-anti-sigma regulatory factor